MSRVFTSLGAFFWPGPCPLCGNDLGPVSPSGVCVACWASLPIRSGDGCGGCDLPLPPGVPTGACADCRRQSVGSRGLEKIRAALVYRDGAVTLHRLLKFSGHTSLLRPLASRMARVLLHRDPFEPDLVTAVPPDPRRWGPRRRLTKALARSVAGQLRIPFSPRALSKSRSTPSQTGLPDEERAGALDGAFTAQAEPVEGRRVLVIDDIATTLATLAAAGRALHAAGALEIHGLVLARTPRLRARL